MAKEAIASTETFTGSDEIKPGKIDAKSSSTWKSSDDTIKKKEISKNRKRSNQCHNLQLHVF